MDYGLFTMPSHPPERKLFDGHQWDLQQLALGGRAGLQRGLDRRAPHRALGATPLAGPAGGPGAAADQAHAHRPRRLPDAVPPPGRAGQSGGHARPSGPGPAQLRGGGERAAERLGLFNVDGMSGQNRDMTRESLDIILRLWSDEPQFDYKGKYWHVTKTGTMFDTLKPHIVPFQKPHPPIGVAGLSKGSDTPQAGGRARVLADEPQPEPGLRLEPLGGGGAGRGAEQAARPSDRPGGWSARSSWPTPTRRRCASPRAA